MREIVEHLSRDDDVKRIESKRQRLSAGYDIHKLCLSEVACDVAIDPVSKQRPIRLVTPAHVQNLKIVSFNGADPVLKDDSSGTQHKEIRVCETRIKTLVLYLREIVQLPRTFHFREAYQNFEACRCSGSNSIQNGKQANPKLTCKQAKQQTFCK